MGPPDCPQGRTLSRSGIFTSLSSKSGCGLLMRGTQGRCDGIMQAALPFPVLALEQQEAPIARLPQLLQTLSHRAADRAIGWVLGLTDLAMTLLPHVNVGMFEGNPLAMGDRDGLSAIVAAFKLTTMIIRLLDPFLAAQPMAGEIGAITAVIVLGRLTFQWFGYIDMSSDADPRDHDRRSRPGAERRALGHAPLTHAGPGRYPTGMRNLDPAHPAHDASCRRLLGVRRAKIDVVGARITQETTDGVVIDFTLDATNSNEVDLPLERVRYALKLNGRAFSPARSAEATVSASARSSSRSRPRSTSPSSPRRRAMSYSSRARWSMSRRARSRSCSSTRACILVPATGRSRFRRGDRDVLETP